MINLDLNTVTDVVLEADSEGRIVDANSSIESTFGYSQKEIIGKSISILMPERYRSNHAKLFSGFKLNPTSRRMGDISARKFIGLDKSGDEFYIDISLSVKEDAEGNKSYIAIIRDITSLVALNDKLNSTISELEIKNKELEQMSYVISHDLKAPTIAAYQLISIIEEDYFQSLPAEVKEFFSEIKRRNVKMSELIDGVLSYSRAGQVNTEKNKVNLEELIHEVKDSLHVPVGFTVKYISDNFEFLASKTQLFQVLNNLIGNGIKYHDKHAGNIEISAIKTIDEIEITVKDDGPGIEDKFHSKIFEMFGTANKKSRTDSTGIGLAIVKKIITQNGGKITINSAPNQGTTFIFTFKVDAIA